MLGRVERKIQPLEVDHLGVGARLGGPLDRHRPPSSALGALLDLVDLHVIAL
ncbi:hypothetical protein OG819_45410 [Streptomyces sp. NBC_01549]|uniref:hypothetical protein n=1 Tax=Streptomyces sp. NBC_01549 TaxID=2975874 RepID=UPI002258EF0A|nr:hypothetical protein [Streptomyces sp. NBC_01549]MCX4596630.1 hypothetical protein [Streptomyces sp. NBC_01549]